MRAILIRYGELYLKGNNRNFFERCLMNNIKAVLDGYNYRFVKSSGRFFIEDYDSDSELDIINKLNKVF